MVALASKYVATEQRMALGIELVDPMRDLELMRAVRIDIEHSIPHKPVLPKERFSYPQQRGKIPQGLCRHDSGRYSLLYYPAIKEQMDLRIYDNHRYYIPRRLRAPLITLAAVEAIEAAEPTDYFSSRVRKPVMFPAAAYDLSEMSTGLRGRVLRDAEPMRWAYIEAHLVSSGALVGRARGDDRGEFLLLLSPDAAPASDLTATLDVRISIYGPTLKPVPTNVELPSLDNLWDLPLEILPAAGLPDTVSAGEAMPVGYVIAPAATQDIAFSLGKILTGVDVNDFIFTLP